MARAYDRGAVCFIHFSLVRHDPYFIERVQRDIGRAVFIMRFLVYPAPEVMTRRPIGIHQPRRHFLEDIILRQKGPPHQRQTKVVGNNAVFLVRGKIDPHVLIRDGHGGKEIFDKFEEFLMLRGRQHTGGCPGIDKEFHAERIFGVNFNTTQDGRGKSGGWHCQERRPRGTRGLLGKNRRHAHLCQKNNQER